MKQYNRGIKAYKAASTGSLTKTEPVKPIETKEPGLIKVTEDDKYTRVAKLLLVLGKDDAASVISHLPPNDIEEISKKISELNRIGKNEALEILREFGKDSKDFNRNQGGVETARSILTHAFGQGKGNEILYKAVPDATDAPFAFLKDLDFTQRMMVLRKESVSVLTVVLNYLPGKYSSPIIEALSNDIRSEIVKRLSKMKRVSPQVINIISDNLKEKIKKLGTADSIDIDGTGTLADILKHMDRGSEESILSDIDSFDRNLGETIKDRLYTIDIIHNIESKDFQNVLNRFSDQEIVFLIKGESVEIQDTIWQAMSQGRRALVEAEMDVIGLIKKSEADKMTKKFIDIIKRMEEQGEIRLLDDDLIY